MTTKATIEAEEGVSTPVEVPDADIDLGRPPTLAESAAALKQAGKGTKPKPEQTGEEKAEVDAEAIRRKAFKAIVKGEQPAEAKKPDKPKPKPEAKADEDDDAPDPEVAESATPDDEDEAPAPKKLAIHGETKEERTMFVKAVRTLRDEGYTDEVLASIKPITILELGRLAKERHREYDRVKRELQETKKALKKGRLDDDLDDVPASDRAPRREGSTRRDPSERDQRGHLDRVLDSLDDEDDDDPRGSLARDDDRESGDDEEQDDRTPARRHDRQERVMPKRDAEIVKRIISRELEDLEERMGDQYPHFQRDRLGTFKRILKRAEAIDDDGRIARSLDPKAMNALLREAAEIEFGTPERASQDRAERARENESLLDGQPGHRENAGRAPISSVDPDLRRKVAWEVSKKMEGQPSSAVQAEVERQLRKRTARN